jgi:hypothetical protein
VQLQVTGEHQVLVGGWFPVPKRKLVSAFHSATQSMPCYMRHRAVAYRKATIVVLRLEEFLRRALL